MGWGQSERTGLKSETIPYQVKLNAVEGSICYTNDSDVASISSTNTFCAGGSGTGPCKGDSGGGFFVSIGNVWYLKGIVSASLFTTESKCDVNRFAIYTNVHKFLRWITANADISSTDIALKCSFSFNHEWSYTFDWYTCEVTDLNVQTDNKTMTSVIGAHDPGSSNNDVEILSMPAQKMKYVFNGAGDVFPNLKKFSCRRCGVEFLARKNFKNMKSLMILDFLENQIESIPSDAFFDLESLMILDLFKNKIKALHVDTFKNLKNLSQIPLGGNRLTKLSQEHFRNNPNLWFIHLGRNQLSEISIDFNFFKGLRYANLAGNPCGGEVVYDKDENKGSLEELSEQVADSCS